MFRSRKAYGHTDYGVFGTFSQNPDSETVQSHITDDTMETVTLKGSEDDTYTFRYDSDIVTYSGQGGNFFLIGSSPTECYLHVMIQSNGSYEDALNTASGSLSLILPRVKTLEPNISSTFTLSYIKALLRRGIKTPCF